MYLTKGNNLKVKKSSARPAEPSGEILFKSVFLMKTLQCLNLSQFQQEKQ